LNFGNPESPRQFAEFVGAIDGLARAARALDVPFVSGNVSLYNESRSGESIPASPIVACVGAMADISRAVTPGFKRAGSAVYRLGAPSYGLGGSVYAQIAGADTRVPLPFIDYGALQKEIVALLTACDRGLVLAAHDVSDGGFLTALAEMCFATLRSTPLGIALDAPPFMDAFDETGAFLVEAADAPAFEEICVAGGVEVVPAAKVRSKAEQGPLTLSLSLPGREGRGYAARIGTTIDEPQIGMPSLTVSIKPLHEAWSTPLQDFFKGAA
jgi:phosphoribosylformylglycinamidine synthase